MAVKNKTAYTRYSRLFIADLRGVSTEELAAATSANAERIFWLNVNESSEVIVVEG